MSTDGGNAGRNAVECNIRVTLELQSRGWRATARKMFHLWMRSAAAFAALTERRHILSIRDIQDTRSHPPGFDGSNGSSGQLAQSGLRGRQKSLPITTSCA